MPLGHHVLEHRLHRHRDEVGGVAQLGLLEPGAGQDGHRQLGQVVEHQVVDLSAGDQLRCADAAVAPEARCAADAHPPAGRGRAWPWLFAGPGRLAFLAKRQLALGGVFGQREQRDLAFGEGHRLLERHRLDLLHRVQAAPDRRRRLVEHATEQPVDTGVQVFAHVVDQAVFERLRRRDRFAGDAHLGQDAARQQLVEHAEHLGREQADLDLGQAEDRLGRGHRHVAHRHHAHAAGHAGAVDAGDQRHGGLARNGGTGWRSRRGARSSRT